MPDTRSFLPLLVGRKTKAFRTHGPTDRRIKGHVRCMTYSLFVATEKEIEMMIKNIGRIEKQKNDGDREEQGTRNKEQTTRNK